MALYYLPIMSKCRNMGHNSWVLHAGYRHLEYLAT